MSEQTLIPCPACGVKISPASLLGAIKSARKSKSSAENGKLGGRQGPPKDPAIMALVAKLGRKRKLKIKIE